MSFISELQKKRANYNCIEQARTQAKSLNLLSSGIYTEEERFIYELLQNAIDSFQDTAKAKLKVNIEIQGNYLVFSHNGQPFTESDIVGLCDVGNGSKERDAKKIGYKGIGFKSVFMTSTQVFLSSKNYTFKFDKEDSVSYMPEHLKPISSDEIPWQIIPIETRFPLVKIDWDEVNVAICIKLKDSTSMIPLIKNLLSQVDFLLFLNVPDIEIAFVCNGQSQLTVKKEMRDGLVELSLDGSLQSAWMLHTASVPIEENVREYIKQNPTSVPDKLKDLRETEVSFAIRIEDDEVVRLKNTVVYTYLPTSYSALDTPFLINANFITDASRQQLQADSAWNQNILRHIPKLYLQWMAQISQHYQESYFNALPELQTGRSGLVGLFHSALKEALQEVPFLPSLHKKECILKVSDAFIDKIDLADTVGAELLVGHLNRVYNREFNTYSRISSSLHRVAQSYGIFTLDWDDMKEFFHDSTLLSRVNPKMNYNLLSLFYKKYNGGNLSEQGRIINSLKDLKCLMTCTNLWKQISICTLPPSEDTLDIPVEEMDIIHPDIYALLERDTSTFDWLRKEFNLSELSKMRFVDLILNRNYAITEDNAIEVGQLLFRINKERAFLNDAKYIDKIQRICFLTKQENLSSIATLFLGTKYRPIQDIETIAPQEDIYISEAYVENWDNELEVQEWAVFLKKCGINDSVKLSHRALKKSQIDGEFMAYEMLKDATEAFSKIKHKYTDYSGHRNTLTRIEVRFQYFTLINLKGTNRQVCQFIFNEVLSKPWDKVLTETIYGEVPFWSEVTNRPDAYIEHSLYDYIPNEYRRYKSFFEFLVSKVQLFPTTMGNSLPSEEIYLNTNNIKSLSGNYLPVLDIENPVHESWLDTLLFKKELSLDDLLELLACISQSQESDKKLSEEDKERIEEIYSRILKQELHISGRDKITEWGKTHCILCSRDGQFYKPSELSYATVQDFSPEKRAFTGKLDKDRPEEVKDFFTTLGVRVVTQITPIFEDRREDNALKKLLRSKLAYLSLLRKEEFTKATLILEERIGAFTCYHCSKISLSYGNEQDIIQKKTYSDGLNFYYIGKLGLACLEGLKLGLTDGLGLYRKQTEEVLAILTTKEHEEICDYLVEKGYDISLLPQQTELSSDSKLLVNPTNSTDLSKEERIEAQREAQKALMSKYTAWTFPEGYGTGEHYSVVRDIKDEQGNQMVIVLKSYRDKSQPLKITAEECEALLKEEGKLYLYTGTAIEERDFISLIGGQESITMSFDASNLTGEQDTRRIEKFVELLHYFKGLHINIPSYDLSVINLYKRQAGEQIETTDDDL